MLHLIADFSLIVTEGGRKDSGDERDEGEVGGGAWANSGKEICL